MFKHTGKCCSVMWRHACILGFASRRNTKFSLMQATFVGHNEYSSMTHILWQVLWGNLTAKVKFIFKIYAWYGVLYLHCRKWLNQWHQCNFCDRTFRNLPHSSFSFICSRAQECVKVVLYFRKIYLKHIWNLTCCLSQYQSCFSGYIIDVL